METMIGLILLGYVVLALLIGAPMPNYQTMPFGLVLFNGFILCLPLVTLYWLARRRSY